MVDYLQLMRVSRAENRNIAVAELSRELKLLARELQVPIVALSQLSREADRRDDERPMLSDLRDSGTLEQDADVVVFIHREEVYKPTPTNNGPADIIIAKQRNGPTGTIRLRWSKPSTRFENLKSADAYLGRPDNAPLHDCAAARTHDTLSRFAAHAFDFGPGCSLVEPLQVDQPSVVHGAARSAYYMRRDGWQWSKP